LKQQHISDLSFFEDLKKRYAHGHAQLQQTWADRLQDRGASLNRFGETDSSKPSSDAKGEVPPGAQSPEQQDLAGTARSSDEQFETVKGLQLEPPTSPALVKGKEPIPGPRALNEAQVVELRTAKLTSIMSKMEQELSKELSVQVKNTRDASQEQADTKSTPSWTPTVTVKHKTPLVKPGVGKVVPAVRPLRRGREKEVSTALDNWHPQPHPQQVYLQNLGSQHLHLQQMISPGSGNVQPNTPQGAAPAQWNW